MARNKPSESLQRIAAKLRLARENTKLTQSQVAKKAEITVNYYAMIERGEVNPSVNKLLKIIKALNIKPLI